MWGKETKTQKTIKIEIGKNNNNNETHQSQINRKYLGILKT